jgi:hypothetical protein
MLICDGSRCRGSPRILDHEIEMDGWLAKVYIAASSYGYVMGEGLEGTTSRMGRSIGGLGDVDGIRPGC